jgi:acetolactate synthase I/II/III large subunit
VSGLAEAYESGVPVLAIVADIPRGWDHLRDRGVASQATGQRELLAPVCKWVARLDHPRAVDDTLDHALRVAVTGRPGPVVLEIPDDVFSAPAERTPRPRDLAGAASWPRYRSLPHPRDVDRAVRVLAGSTRPLLLAGGGALASAAGEAITAFARSLGVPVATTIDGKGAVDERRPLAAGVVGAFGSTIANRALRAADTVLVIGRKLDQLSTFDWRLPADGQIVLHVDADATEIGRAVPVDLGLVGDARETVTLLHAGLTGTVARWNWYATGERNGTRVVADGEGDGVSPVAVVRAISDTLDSGDVLVSDASLASGWAAAHHVVKRAGRGMIAPRGLAGIGWAGGAALGARGGAPGRCTGGGARRGRRLGLRLRRGRDRCADGDARSDRPGRTRPARRLAGPAATCRHWSPRPGGRVSPDQLTLNGS